MIGDPRDDLSAGAQSDFLSPAELELWREGVDGAVADRGPLGPGASRLPAGHFEAHESSEEEVAGWKVAEGTYENVFTQRLNLWMVGSLQQRRNFPPTLAAQLPPVAPPCPNAFGTSNTCYSSEVGCCLGLVANEHNLISLSARRTRSCAS